MKQLVDYDKLSDYLIERREAHINAFTDFRYAYGRDKLTIDDVIYEAKAVKELNALGDKIETFAPSMDELTKVYNAVIRIAKTLKESSNATADDGVAVRAIIDYLGIDVEDLKKDTADEAEE